MTKTAYLSLLIGGLTVLCFSGCARAGLNTPLHNTSGVKYDNAYALCKNGQNDKTIEAKINELLEKNMKKGNDLEIYCEVTEYVEGNRALRYFVGFGAGRGKSMTLVKLVDTNTKQQVADFKVEGGLTMGAFGGDSQGMLNETGETIFKQVKDNFLK